MAAILAGILFEFIQGQGEFARFQGAREEVQANSRLGLEMIGSDLRGTPRLAIQVAAADSIRFYSPRNWGVVCQVDDPQVGLTTTVAVRIAGPLSSEFIENQPGWGIAVGQSDAPSAPPSGWAFMPNVSATDVTCPTGIIGAWDGGNEPDEQSFANTTTGFASYDGAAPLTLTTGTTAFVFEEVKYDVGPDAGGRLYVRRMSGYDPGTGQPNMEPLAGPLPSAAGLQFRYFDVDGNILDPSANTPALLTPLQMSVIGAIQVIVQTESSEEFGSSRVPQDAQDTTLVRLRN